MVADPAYYDLLGIDENASPEDVKKAYRAKVRRFTEGSGKDETLTDQARQHHPDKNPDDPAAHETFQKIGQAYETLSDPDERAAYDRYGTAGPGRPGPSDFDGPDLDDLFAHMFGGGGGGGFGGASFDPFGPGPSRKPTRGKDTDVRYEISLEEAFKGKKVVVNLSRDRTCGMCSGTGGRKGAKKDKCGRCGGKGTIVQDRHLGPGLVGKMKVTCDECEGEGERFSERAKCKRCKGVKVVPEKKRVEFEIEPGTEDGERIALRGEGDEIPGIPPGDVIFHIHHRPHPLFRPLPRSDLAINLTISLSEALLGMNRLMFTHLDGKGIRIETKRGERIIKHGDELVINSEGMPVRGSNGRRGDLRVKFSVEMPGLSWASRTDPQSTVVELPRPPKDLEPAPEVVVTRYLSPLR